MDELPMTLHDAIIRTRQLGIQYIWINSMCIIQDSRDDWRREAANMASIYGSATLTISAASSSVYGGLTDRQNPLPNCAASLDLQEASSQRTVYILTNGQQPNQPPGAPTDLRSWCHQEDILSSRLVKLTQTHTEWLCMGDKRNLRFAAARNLGLAHIASLPVHQWCTPWYRFVEHYTDKRISYPGDNLWNRHVQDWPRLPRRLAEARSLGQSTVVSLRNPDLTASRKASYRIRRAIVVLGQYRRANLVLRGQEQTVANASTRTCCTRSRAASVNIQPVSKVFDTGAVQFETRITRLWPKKLTRSV